MYETIARCVDPDCHCNDRAGIILYSGPDLQAARDAEMQSPRGYAVQVNRRTDDGWAPVK